MKTKPAPPADLTFQCRCGHLTWVVTGVSPDVSNRIICHCHGCRTFAQRTDPTLLDEHGGTERMQVSPATVRVTAGADALGCVQQTPGGALRWLARCCNTPLGLTLTGHRVPFVGLDVKRIRTDALPVPLTELIGPVRARLNRAFPRAQRRTLRADLPALLRMLIHLAPLTFRWWRRGDHRRSPFFTLPSGTPVVAVQRLYPNPRARLLAAGCR